MAGFFSCIIVSHLFLWNVVVALDCVFLSSFVNQGFYHTTTTTAAAETTTTTKTCQKFCTHVYKLAADLQKILGRS